MASIPKRPAKTAEEVVVERRQRTLLDKEIEESEERFKALARGRLGRRSLLSGAPVTALQAAGGATRGVGGGGSSLLSGGQRVGGATRTATRQRQAPFPRP